MFVYNYKLNVIIVSILSYLDDCSYRFHCNFFIKELCYSEEHFHEQIPVQHVVITWDIHVTEYTHSVTFKTFWGEHECLTFMHGPCKSIFV